MTISKDTQARRLRRFYEDIDREHLYAPENDPGLNAFCGLLNAFIEKWKLQQKRCLEVGSSRGFLQDVVSDYTGVDLAASLATYYHKPFCPVEDALLPFPNDHFDAIFSYSTYEHIPDIEIAFEELIRVLKPGGICLLAPAWHTRPWFSEGYAVRPYSGLTLRQRLVKASIPIRDHPLIRHPLVILRRAIHLGDYLLSAGRPSPLRYRRLKANYEAYWQSDSDACNSLDPFDVILWFRSRGMVCHGYTNLARSLFVRTYALELQKPLRRCIG